MLFLAGEGHEELAPGHSRLMGEPAGLLSQVNQLGRGQAVRCASRRARGGGKTARFVRFGAPYSAKDKFEFSIPFFYYLSDSSWTREVR